MTIRPCKQTDIEDCAKLLAAVYSEAPYRESWKVADASNYLERFWRIEPEACFIAIEQTEVAGAIFSFSYPWQAGTLTCIQELFVSQKQRQKGIAKQLLKSLSGENEISVWLVAHENSDATAFYKKMGFSQTGPYKFNHGVVNKE